MRPARDLTQELIDRVLSPEDEAAQLSLVEGDVPDNDTEPYDFSEDFWLAKPYYGEEFARDAIERFSTHIELWEEGQLGHLVWQAYRAYHNMSGIGGDPLTQLQEAGEVGELLALAIPHYRSLVRHQIALFTAERPAWDPQARTSDASAARQVPMAANLLDYVASGGQLDQRLAEQVELMMISGVGYFVTAWDPQAGPGGRGWFSQRVYAPWELCHERVRTYDDATWWIYRAFESRWDWVARYAQDDPEKAERIAKLDAKHGDFGSSLPEYDEHLLGDEGDRIPVLYIIARPTLACKTGRLAIVAADDLVLHDGPHPYGEDITISRMCASEFLGTSLPYCDSWGVLAAAEAYNAILSMIITRIDTCGVPNFCVPEGSEIEFSDVAGGNAVWKLPPGAEKPSVVDLLQLPDALPAVMNLIAQQMEQVVGINSVTRGQPAENVSSGSMAALLQGMAIQYNSNLERAWGLNLERIGTHHLRVFQAMATEEHDVAVLGADQKWTVQKFRGADVNQVLRVAVKTASALSKTTAGRAEIAGKLLERGLIQPQEYLRVIQTGQLEPLFAGPVGALTTLKSRGEKLMQGQAAPALVWDNHQLAVREFSAMLNGDVRDDQRAVQALMQAIQEHYDHWAKLSREAPDMLAAIGCPPLPQALSVGQQAQAMQSQAGGMPPGPPPQNGPPPQQQRQPETDAPRGRPGPAPNQKGEEPSKTNPKQPTEPKPARNPLDGKPVV